MPDESVNLVRTKNADGVRNVWATVDALGDLVIEGQDLGRGVEAFYGPGNTEYEWEVRVEAANLPRLLALIGAAPGAPLLEALTARFGGEAAHTLRQFLEQHGIAGPGWTRVGS